MILLSGRIGNPFLIHVNWYNSDAMFSVTEAVQDSPMETCPTLPTIIPGAAECVKFGATTQYK